MLRGLGTNRWGMLAIGLLLGLAIGVATAAIALHQRGPAMTMMPSLAELQLKASASHGAETFAVATGHVDDDVEGLFALDFLTGDLQCLVVNPRNGMLGGWFKSNVSAALAPEKGKKPSYLLVTGQINVAGGYGGQRPAASLCYVVDANTGEVAAFTFPWAKAMTTAGVAQASEMRLV